MSSEQSRNSALLPSVRLYEIAERTKSFTVQDVLHIATNKHLKKQTKHKGRGHSREEGKV